MKGPLGPGLQGAAASAAGEGRERSCSDERPAPYDWYVLIVLTVIFLLASVDRSLVSVVMEPVRHEFGLTDAQLGFLALGGIAHGLFGTGGPMIVYVARRRLADKLAFRSTLAVLWLALNAALLTKFITTGLYQRPVFEVGSVLALVIVPGLFVTR